MWELCCGAIHKRSKTTKSYNYFREDYDSLNSYFKEMDWSSRFEGHDIDHNYNLFVQAVSSAIDIYIPRVSKANKAKPSWWSKRLSVAVCIRKVYSTNGKPPRLVVTIRPMLNKETQSNQ